ncbi:MAG: nucleotidyltransferase family protein [Terracidiphilus sp.]
MILELRWRLDFVHPKYSRSIGLDWIGSHRQSVQLAGKEIESPDAEATLLLLCMHGCKHRWSRLTWICDVAQLFRSSTHLDRVRIRAEAKEAALRKAFALGMLLARDVAGVGIPSEIVGEFDSFPSVQPLANAMMCNLSEQTGLQQAGSIPYHVRLLDRPDLLRFVLSIAVLRPTPRDQEFFPLPRSLRWMHVLIRPFRLLVDRSAR